MRPASVGYHLVVMGLDVYLKKYPAPAGELLPRVQQYNDSDLHQSEAEDSEQQLAALAEALGLDEYGEVAAEYVEINSAQYPEHMFKIGYMRSSYNQGGINSVLRSYGLRDLYGIFEVDGEEYRVVPDWAKAAANAREVAEEYKATIEAMGGCRIQKFAYNPFIKPEIKSSAEAAEAWKRELARGERSPGFESYSNGKGTFFFGSTVPKLRAVLMGLEEALIGDGMAPCTYLVFEAEEPEEGKGGIENDYYYQSLLIAAEMCDWVLAQPDADNYVLHWSG